MIDKMEIAMKLKNLVRDLEKETETREVNAAIGHLNMAIGWLLKAAQKNKMNS